MTTFNINLPESLRAFVDDQARRAGHADAAAYVASLLRREQRRQARAQLEAEVLKGLDSGPATEMTRDDWAELRRRLEERIAKRGA